MTERFLSWRITATDEQHKICKSREFNLPDAAIEQWVDCTIGVRGNTPAGSVLFFVFLQKHESVGLNRSDSYRIVEDAGLQSGHNTSV